MRGVILTSMRTMWVVVPPGVEPGSLFQIQTPSGDMLQVTCPPGASAGQQIPVVVPARAGSEAAPLVPAQMERVPPPPHAHARAHAHVRPSLKPRSAASRQRNYSSGSRISSATVSTPRHPRRCHLPRCRLRRRRRRRQCHHQCQLRWKGGRRNECKRASQACTAWRI